MVRKFRKRCNVKSKSKKKNNQLVNRNHEPQQPVTIDRIIWRLFSIETISSTILKHYLTHHAPIAVDAITWQTNVNSRCISVRKDNPKAKPNDFDPEPHLFDTCRFFKYSREAYAHLQNSTMSMSQFRHFVESSNAYHQYLDVNIFEVRCDEVLKKGKLWFEPWLSYTRPHFQRVTKLYLSDPYRRDFDIRAVQTVLEAFPNLKMLGFDVRANIWAVVNPAYMPDDWYDLPGPRFLVNFLRKYCGFKGNVMVGASSREAGVVDGRKWGKIAMFVDEWHKRLIWDEDAENGGCDSDDENEDDEYPEPVKKITYRPWLYPVANASMFEPPADGP